MGDILVGADGAYSSVRKGLYEKLKKEGRLPESDQEDLPFRCICLVGQTEPLDLEVYSQLKDPWYPFYTTIGDNKQFIVSHLHWEGKGGHITDVQLCEACTNTAISSINALVVPFPNGREYHSVDVSRTAGCLY